MDNICVFLVTILVKLYTSTFYEILTFFASVYEVQLQFHTICCIFLVLSNLYSSPYFAVFFYYLPVFLSIFSMYFLLYWQSIGKSVFIPVGSANGRVVVVTRPSMANFEAAAINKFTKRNLSKTFEYCKFCHNPTFLHYNLVHFWLVNLFDVKYFEKMLLAEAKYVITFSTM